MTCSDPRNLPGFRKKSFSMPFGGGEIWFEHLDGIYEYSALVLEKLSGDIKAFSRPSGTSLIAFVTDETVITQEIIDAIAAALLDTKKVFTRVCFIGTDKKIKKAFEAALKNKRFALGFINDFEKAKEWLICETL